MDGDATLDELRSYVSRLTGQEQAADAPLTLRSVHRAALASWARGRKLTLNLASVSASTPFTLRDLLAGVPSPAGTAVPSPAGMAAPVLAVPAGGMGIGIDIEDVASLPEAADYREHAFYRDSFTAAEIAHCLLQPDARASFCGLWAAKEAILKSGLASAPDGKLNRVEIGWDGRGRPIAAGCLLSISHTPTTAVAVCLAAQAAPAGQAAGPAVIEMAAAPQRQRRGIALVAASVLAGVIVAGLALQFSAHAVHFG